MGEPRSATTTPLLVEITDHAGVPVIAVAGEVDMVTDQPVRAALAAQFDRRPAALVLDLSGVDFFGSHGVQLLLSAMTWAQRQETALAVVAGHRAVLRTLEITKVDQVVDIHPTLRGALAAAQIASVPPGRRTTHLVT